MALIKGFYFFPGNSDLPVPTNLVKSVYLFSLKQACVLFDFSSEKGSIFKVSMDFFENDNDLLHNPLTLPDFPFRQGYITRT